MTVNEAIVVAPCLSGPVGVLLGAIYCENRHVAHAFSSGPNDLEIFFIEPIVGGRFLLIPHCSLSPYLPDIRDRDGSRIGRIEDQSANLDFTLTESFAPGQSVQLISAMPH